MRPSLIAAATALLLAVPLAWAATPPKDGETRRSWTIPAIAAGQLLDLQLRTGAGLTIAAWDRDEVTVESDWDETRCRDARIEVTKTDLGVLIRSTYPPGTAVVNHNCSFSFVVKVPRAIDIRLRSAGGSVAISGVRGDIRGQTGGGKIELHGLHGSVALRTGGGGILARDSDLEGRLSTGGGRVRFENVSGGVTGRSGTMRGLVRGGTGTIVLF